MPYGGTDVDQPLPVLMERMEAMQAQLQSPHQPDRELDGLIAEAVAAHPEQRARMAVLARSTWLRKRILTIMPSGGRAVGSATLGTSHAWRRHKVDGALADHNWPRSTAGGDQQQVRLNPLMTHSQCFSVPRAKRFPGTLDDGTIDKVARQIRSTPGPGSYQKTVPRGVRFLADGGETVVYGANHATPWKCSLGRQINPIDVDATTLTAAPKYTFPKSRRALSEVSMGSMTSDGGAAKSDEGCLSPGLVYEHYSSFRPGNGPKAKAKKRRSASTPSLRKIRSVYVPPEEPSQQGGGEAAASDFEQFGG